MGGMYESGFAAERVTEVGFNIDEEKVLGKQFNIEVTHKETPGVPSMVVSIRYTDKGTLTKEVLDQNIQALLKKSGFKVSANTLWQRTPVVWRWQMLEGSGVYFPVVASGPLEGTRYAGAAILLPAANPTDVMLAKLPTTMDIYTIALTSEKYDLSVGDAARALTLIKQGLVNMNRYDGYYRLAVVMRGVETSVFSGAVQARPVDPNVDPPTPGLNTGVVVGLGLLALLALYTATRDQEGAVT